MKKALMITGLVVALTGAALYLAREPLLAVVVERLTADMFVAADADDFDPGLAVGQTFPAILARHDGGTVTDLARFRGDQGLVLFANRSVEW